MEAEEEKDGEDVEVGDDVEVGEDVKGVDAVSSGVEVGDPEDVCGRVNMRWRRTKRIRRKVHAIVW